METGQYGARARHPAAALRRVPAPIRHRRTVALTAADQTRRRATPTLAMIRRTPAVPVLPVPVMAAELPARRRQSSRPQGVFSCSPVLLSSPTACVLSSKKWRRATARALLVCFQLHDQRSSLSLHSHTRTQIKTIHCIVHHCDYNFIHTAIIVQTTPTLTSLSSRICRKRNSCSTAPLFVCGVMMVAAAGAVLRTPECAPTFLAQVRLAA